jgi:hypothetical protein
LQFGFRGPRNPQRNSKVKKKIITLNERIRAMFIDLGIVDENQKGHWTESASTASFYE